MHISYINSASLINETVGESKNFDETIRAASVMKFRIVDLAKSITVSDFASLS